ncbi:MAG: hypothetical protein N2654_07025, partial [Deltaproteobacteria bacterium]|nr:hypothetical protein [Deltaproteobacteria bacterium]
LSPVQIVFLGCSIGFAYLLTFLVVAATFLKTEPTVFLTHNHDEKKSYINRIAIYDRNGIPLSSSFYVADIYVHPNRISSADEVA